MAQVIGTVVATQKVEGMRGIKLLLVQPVDETGKHRGHIHAAADTVGAGTGDLVYLVGSREAALALETWFVPVDAAIVGYVDDIQVDDVQLLASKTISNKEKPI